MQTLSNTSYQDRLQTFLKTVESGQIHTLAPLLPLLLTLKGRPYTLDDYAPFEPLFNTRMVDKLTLKSGRQLSKCRRKSLSGKDLRRFNGEPISIQSLKIGDELLTLDDNYRFVGSKVTNIWHTGDKPLLTIKTRMGSTVHVTQEHRLKTLGDYTAASELQVGSRLASVRRGGSFNNEYVRSDRIILTAYMLGDGCCGTTTMWNMTATSPVFEEFMSLVTPLEKQGPKVRVRNPIVGVFDIRLHMDNLLIDWLKEDGSAGKYSYEKSLPPWVFNLSYSDTILFLSRLWATDGSVICNGKISPNISYSSSSHQLAEDVRSLLNKLGMPAKIETRAAGYKNSKTGEYKKCLDNYVVHVETRAGWERFNEIMRVPGKPPVELPITKQNSNRDTTPHEVMLWIRELATSIPCRHGKTLHAAGLRLKPKYPPSTTKLSEYITYFERVIPGHPRLRDLINLRDGDVIWDEIISIEDGGTHPTVDIEIEDTHNYVMDGIVSHNSTSVGASSIVLANAIPFFNTLLLCPLYEQVRRLSANVIRPFVEQSPVKALWTGTSTENSVLQRSFKNQSKLFFSFALLDAERVRGFSAEKIIIDECQNLDRDHLPVIIEVMSASKWGILWLTGTPKTLDNLLEESWQKSSMAEWFIKCTACNHWNIPAIEHDLLKMIGPLHDDISEKVPGTICAKCQRPIYPRTGRWVHRTPENRMTHSGYHIPQIILPLHYASKKKWRELLNKQRGYGNTTYAKFLNECMGESCEQGIKLVTQTDLRNAATLPWHNDPDHPINIVPHTKEYGFRCLAVDWGGGSSDELKGKTSFTTMAVLCFHGSGRIDVVWGKRLLTPHDPIGEAKECLKIFNDFDCHFMTHDYTGAGNLRETFLVHAGLSAEKIIPISLCRTAAHDIMTFHAATTQHPRDYWLLDKARSLQLICGCIKFGTIRFFKYDHESSDNPGLLHDFLALMENKVETAHAGDIYTIVRSSLGGPDDFAQAVNMGACAIYHTTGAWPNLALMCGLSQVAASMPSAIPALTVQQVEAGAPSVAWGPEENNMGGFMNMPSSW